MTQLYGMVNGRDDIQGYVIKWMAHLQFSLELLSFEEVIQHVVEMLLFSH